HWADTHRPRSSRRRASRSTTCAAPRASRAPVWQRRSNANRRRAFRTRGVARPSAILSRMDLGSTDPDRPGVFAFGQFCRGIFALGQMSVGVVAVGQLAMGCFVLGQGAVGLVAVGQGAIGVLYGVGM